MALIVQTSGVVGTLLAATIAVRSYVNSNKRAEDARARELQTRQAQLFMGLYEKFSTPEYVKYFTDVANGPSFEDYASLKKKFAEDQEYGSEFNVLVGYYEGIGTLVKEDLIDIRYVALLMAGVTRKFWEKIAPFIDDLRRDFHFPRYMSETEYLYDRLTEYLEQHPELKT